MNVTAEIPLVLVAVSPATDARAGRWSEIIKRLARLSSISVSPAPPQGAVQLVVRGEVVALPLKGVIDFSAEQARLEKELARALADISRVDGKLGNADFLRRAPDEVVEGEREKRAEADARRQKILEALERLKGAA
jgi:valyl-tRNA synthetase